MTNQHPITPPPELVQQWHLEAMTGFRTNGIYEQDIATQPVTSMDKLDRLIALDRDDPANADELKNYGKC